MMFALSARRAVLVGLFAVLATAGCGPSGPRRFQLTGTVTYAGKPVPNGTIRFEADVSKGNKGPVGYAVITDGSYTTAAQGSRGALQGPLVVVLSGGPSPDPRREFSPVWFADYTTTLTLEPKSGITTFDIDVPERAQR